MEGAEEEKGRSGRWGGEVGVGGDNDNVCI